MPSHGAYLKLLSSVFSSTLDPLFLPRTGWTTANKMIKIKNSPTYVPPAYTDAAFRESVAAANVFANIFPYIEPGLKNLFTSILTVFFHVDDNDVPLSVIRDQCLVNGDYLRFNEDLREMKKYLSPVKHIYFINDSFSGVYCAILEKNLRLSWNDPTIRMILREGSIAWKCFSVMITSNLEDDSFYNLMTIEPSMVEFVIDGQELISYKREREEEGFSNILYWNLSEEERKLMESDDPSEVMHKEVDKIRGKCKEIMAVMDGWDDVKYSSLKNRVHHFMQDIIACQLAASRYE